MVSDITSGKDIGDAFSDGWPAAFSPDGEHSAAITGSPHSFFDAEREPRLEIDGTPVYPTEGRSVNFLSRPEWSPDGTAVAAVTQNAISGEEAVTGCVVQNGCQSTLLLGNAGGSVDTFKLQWRDGAVIASSRRGGWSMQLGDVRAKPSNQIGQVSIAVTDTEADFESKIQQVGGDAALGLIKDVRKRGGLEPDMWCQSCGLPQLLKEAHHL